MTSVSEIVERLPVISLWQPYASLAFAKIEGRFVKQNETRGRRPPQKYVGQRVGIHATAKFPPLKLISEELHELCMDVFGCSYNHSLPQGALLGTVILGPAFATDAYAPASDEGRIAGDWTRGRFAWPLVSPEKFEPPIPAKGAQGWWFADVAALRALSSKTEER